MKSSRKKIATLTSSHLLATLDNCSILCIINTVNIDDQTDTFQYELAKLIYHFKSEYDINDYTIAGCLDFAKLSVLTETDDVIFHPEEEQVEDDNNEPFEPSF